MVRTQISLTETQKSRLDAKAAETGLSLSDLVRRALDRYCLSDRDVDADVEAIRQAAGGWADRDFDGEQYAEHMRPARRPER